MRISNGVRRIEDSVVQAAHAMKPRAAKFGRYAGTYAARAAAFVIVAPAVVVVRAIDGVAETALATKQIDLRTRAERCSMTEV